MKAFKLDVFMMAMVLVIIGAALFPHLGAKNGPLHAGLIGQFAIGLVFFLNGAQLSFKAMREGLLSWKSHLLIQGATFLFYPLLGLIFFVLITHLSPTPTAKFLGLGVFYLCSVPSTISSSVTMTSQAHGHVAVAIFNASLSSLVGIFMTPFLVSIALKTSGQPIDFMPILIDLLKLIVAPMIFGQIMRPFIGAWLGAHKRFAHLTDRIAILIIIFTSFCDSFLSHVFEQTGLWDLVIIVLVSAGLLGLGIVALLAASKALRLEFSDQIAVVFCGVTKSMASGVAMAGLIFAGTGLSAGSLLLPLMIYHPLQLSVFSILAQRWARLQS